MDTMQGLPLNVRQWLNQRGITNNIISSYHIGWTGEMIKIPITKNGKFLFNKYRRSPFKEEGPKYIYDKGASVELFGTDSMKYNDAVFICEGEFDALLLVSKGLSAVSSTGGSMSFKEEWSELFKDKDVLVCYDNDEAGIKGAMNVHRVLPNAKIIVLPEGVINGGDHKDVTDFFKSGHDEDAFLALAHNALSFRPFPDPQTLREDKEFIIIYKNYADNLLAIQSTLRMEGKDNALLSAFLAEFVKIIEESKKKLKKPYTGNGDRLERAKQVPISNFIKFNKSHFAKCIWHQEKTPSLNYSPRYNRVYCFGCSRGGDVVDVVQALHKISLPEALTLLLNEKKL